MSIDPDRLLPGENTESEDDSDTTHWIGVYAELLQTKRRLVASLLELMEPQSKDAREELQRADVQMLEMQIRRFERRLAFWQQRHVILTALNGHKPEKPPE